jgi:hypothetical protein
VQNPKNLGCIQLFYRRQVSLRTRKTINKNPYKMYILKTRNKKDQTAEILWKVYQCTTHISKTAPPHGMCFRPRDMCLGFRKRFRDCRVLSAMVAFVFLCVQLSPCFVFQQNEVVEKVYLRLCVRIRTRFVCLNDHSTMTRLFK